MVVAVVVVVASGGMVRGTRPLSPKGDSGEASGRRFGALGRCVCFLDPKKTSAIATGRSSTAERLTDEDSDGGGDGGGGGGGGGGGDPW